MLKTRHRENIIFEGGLASKIKMVIDNPSALYLFDQELSQRVFTPEAEA